MPLTSANLILKPMFPIALPKVIIMLLEITYVFVLFNSFFFLLKLVDVCISFIGGVWMFLYIYGTCRSFSVSRVGIFKFVLLLLTGVFVTPFKVVVENIAVIWGLFTPKHKFFVVKKDIFQHVWWQGFNQAVASQLGLLSSLNLFAWSPSYCSYLLYLLYLTKTNVPF